MSNSLHTDIHRRMDRRETSDLLAIWVQNDHTAWTQEAFDAIQEILEERGVLLPEQVSLPKQRQSVQRPPLEQPARKEVGTLSLLFSIGAVIIGFFSLCVSSVHIREIYLLERQGLTTQAIVTARRDESTTKFAHLFIDYEFVTPGGKSRYYDTAEVPGTLYDSVSEGSSIDIVYLPSNPKISNIKRNNLFPEIVGILAGVVFIIFLGWNFWKKLYSDIVL